MSLTPYSSVSAFIAHCRALRGSMESGTGGAAARPALHALEALAESERLLAGMSEAERIALGLTHPRQDPAATLAAGEEGWPAAARQPSSPASRRRARAELKLHRVLAAHGLLTG